MARQNNIPKGAGLHLRPPASAAHDPAAPGQAYGSPYPQQYEPHEHDGQHTLPDGAPRDIFSALRPETPSLSSRFEPFAPPTGRPQPQGGFGHQPYGEPDGQSYGDQGHDPYGRPLPGGYPAQSGYGSAAGAEHDLHDQHYYGQQPQQGYAPQGRYAPDDAYAYDDPYRPNAADPYASGQHMASGQGGDGGYYEDDYADEPEVATRRGPRAVIVVGALIGAIALGGGLAYAYKAMTNGGREGGKLPILRADSAPAKAKPAEPGGRQMAHTDKKFLNRLDEERGAARPVPVSIHPPEPERDAGEGPRRVPTLVVNRDGTIAPNGGPNTAPAAPPSSGVPGLLVDGLTPRMPPPRREAPPPPPPQRSAQPIEPPAPAAPPQRVASAPPTTAIEPPPAAAPAPLPRPRPEEARRSAPTRQAALTPPPAAAAPSSGYVAVLASRQSHMDALKSLADIQQKHPGILQGRAADVRQANLGEKGVWYRVVVGPPASRATANSVCSRLKTEGYSGCWIMSY